MACQYYTVYVGRLTPGTKKNDLWTLFGGCGRVEDIHICKKEGTGTPLCYGFVRFSDLDSAERAVRELDGWQVRASHIVVQLEKATQMKLNSGYGPNQMTHNASYSDCPRQSRYRDFIHSKMTIEKTNKKSYGRRVQRTSRHDDFLISIQNENSYPQVNAELCYGSQCGDKLVNPPYGRPTSTSSFESHDAHTSKIYTEQNDVRQSQYPGASSISSVYVSTTIDQVSDSSDCDIRTSAASNWDKAFTKLNIQPSSAFFSDHSFETAVAPGGPVLQSSHNVLPVNVVQESYIQYQPELNNKMFQQQIQTHKLLDEDLRLCQPYQEPPTGNFLSFGSSFQQVNLSDQVRSVDFVPKSEPLEPIYSDSNKSKLEHYKDTLLTYSTQEISKQNNICHQEKYSVMVCSSFPISNQSQINETELVKNNEIDISQIPLPISERKGADILGYNSEKENTHRDFWVPKYDNLVSNKLEEMKIVNEQVPQSYGYSNAEGENLGSKHVDVNKFGTYNAAVSFKENTVKQEIARMNGKTEEQMCQNRYNVDFSTLIVPPPPPRQDSQSPIIPPPLPPPFSPPPLPPPLPPPPPPHLLLNADKKTATAEAYTTESKISKTKKEYHAFRKEKLAMDESNYHYKMFLNPRNQFNNKGAEIPYLKAADGLSANENHKNRQVECLKETSGTVSHENQYKKANRAKAINMALNNLDHSVIWNRKHHSSLNKFITRKSTETAIAPVKSLVKKNKIEETECRKESTGRETYLTSCQKTSVAKFQIPHRNTRNGGLTGSAVFKLKLEDCLKNKRKQSTTKMTKVVLSATEIPASKLELTQNSCQKNRENKTILNRKIVSSQTKKKPVKSAVVTKRKNTTKEPGVRYLQVGIGHKTLLKPLSERNERTNKWQTRNNSAVMKNTRLDLCPEILKKDTENILGNNVAVSTRNELSSLVKENISLKFKKAEQISESLKSSVKQKNSVQNQIPETPGLKPLSNGIGDESYLTRRKVASLPPKLRHKVIKNFDEPVMVDNPVVKNLPKLSVVIKKCKVDLNNKGSINVSHMNKKRNSEASGTIASIDNAIPLKTRKKFIDLNYKLKGQKTPRKRRNENDLDVKGTLRAQKWLLLQAEAVDKINRCYKPYAIAKRTKTVVDKPASNPAPLPCISSVLCQGTKAESYTDLMQMCATKEKDCKPKVLLNDVNANVLGKDKELIAVGNALEDNRSSLIEKIHAPDFDNSCTSYLDTPLTITYPSNSFESGTNINKSLSSSSNLISHIGDVDNIQISGETNSQKNKIDDRISSSSAHISDINKIDSSYAEFESLDTAETPLLLIDEDLKHGSAKDAAVISNVPCEYDLHGAMDLRTNNLTTHLQIRSEPDTFINEPPYVAYPFIPDGNQQNQNSLHRNDFHDVHKCEKPLFDPCYSNILRLPTDPLYKSEFVEPIFQSELAPFDYSCKSGNRVMSLTDKFKSNPAKDRNITMTSKCHTQIISENLCSESVTCSSLTSDNIVNDTVTTSLEQCPIKNTLTVQNQKNAEICKTSDVSALQQLLKMGKQQNIVNNNEELMYLTRESSNTINIEEGNIAIAEDTKTDVENKYTSAEAQCPLIIHDSTMLNDKREPGLMVAEKCVIVSSEKNCSSFDKESTPFEAQCQKTKNLHQQPQLDNKSTVDKNSSYNPNSCPEIISKGFKTASDDKMEYFTSYLHYKKDCMQIDSNLIEKNDQNQNSARLDEFAVPVFKEEPDEFSYPAQNENVGSVSNAEEVQDQQTCADTENQMNVDTESTHNIDRYIQSNVSFFDEPETESDFNKEKTDCLNENGSAVTYLKSNDQMIKFHNSPVQNRNLYEEELHDTSTEQKNYEPVSPQKTEHFDCVIPTSNQNDQLLTAKKEMDLRETDYVSMQLDLSKHGLSYETKCLPFSNYTLDLKAAENFITTGPLEQTFVSNGKNRDKSIVKETTDKDDFEVSGPQTAVVRSCDNERSFGDSEVRTSLYESIIESQDDSDKKQFCNFNNERRHVQKEDSLPGKGFNISQTNQDQDDSFRDEARKSVEYVDKAPGTSLTECCLDNYILDISNINTSKKETAEQDEVIISNGIKDDFLKHFNNAADSNIKACRVSDLPDYGSDKNRQYKADGLLGNSSDILICADIPDQYISSHANETKCFVMCADNDREPETSFIQSFSKTSKLDPSSPNASSGQHLKEDGTVRSDEPRNFSVVTVDAEIKCPSVISADKNLSDTMYNELEEDCNSVSNMICSESLLFPELKPESEAEGSSTNGASHCLNYGKVLKANADSEQKKSDLVEVYLSSAICGKSNTELDMDESLVTLHQSPEVSAFTNMANNIVITSDECNLIETELCEMPCGRNIFEDMTEDILKGAQPAIKCNPEEPQDGIDVQPPTLDCINNFSETVENASYPNNTPMEEILKETQSSPSAPSLFPVLSDELMLKDNNHRFKKDIVANRNENREGAKLIEHSKIEHSSTDTLVKENIASEMTKPSRTEKSLFQSARIFLGDFDERTLRKCRKTKFDAAKNPFKSEKDGKQMRVCTISCVNKSPDNEKIKLSQGCEEFLLRCGVDSNHYATSKKYTKRGSENFVTANKKFKKAKFLTDDQKKVSQPVSTTSSEYKETSEGRTFPKTVVMNRLLQGENKVNLGSCISKLKCKTKEEKFYSGTLISDSKRKKMIALKYGKDSNLFKSDFNKSIDEKLKIGVTVNRKKKQSSADKIFLRKNNNQAEKRVVKPEISKKHKPGYCDVCEKHYHNIVAHLKTAKHAEHAVSAVRNMNRRQRTEKKIIRQSVLQEDFQNQKTASEGSQQEQVGSLPHIQLIPALVYTPWQQLGQQQMPRQQVPLAPITIPIGHRPMNRCKGYQPVPTAFVPFYSLKTISKAVQESGSQQKTPAQYDYDNQQISVQESCLNDQIAIQQDVNEERVQMQTEPKIHERVPVEQEPVNQKEVPGEQDSVNQNSASVQETVHNQKFLSEQEIVNKQKFPTEPETVNDEKFLSEQETVNKQKFPTEHEILNQQKFPLEQEIVNKQKFPTEQETVHNQKFTLEQETVNNQVFPSEQDTVNKQAFPSEQESVNKQMFPSEQEFVNNQKFPSGPEAVNKQKFPSEQEIVDKQKFPSEQGTVNEQKFPSEQKIIIVYKQRFPLEPETVKKQKFPSEQEMVNKQKFPSEQGTVNKQKFLSEKEALNNGKVSVQQDSVADEEATDQQEPINQLEIQVKQKSVDEQKETEQQRSTYNQIVSGEQEATNLQNLPVQKLAVDVEFVKQPEIPAKQIFIEQNIAIKKLSINEDVSIKHKCMNEPMVQLQHKVSNKQKVPKQQESLNNQKIQQETLNKQKAVVEQGSVDKQKISVPMNLKVLMEQESVEQHKVPIEHDSIIEQNVPLHQKFSSEQKVPVPLDFENEQKVPSQEGSVKKQKIHIDQESVRRQTVPVQQDYVNERKVLVQKECIAVQKNAVQLWSVNKQDEQGAYVSQEEVKQDSEQKVSIHQKSIYQLAAPVQEVSTEKQNVLFSQTLKTEQNLVPEP